MIVNTQWAVVKQKLASKRPASKLIMHTYIPEWITYRLLQHEYFTETKHEQSQ